jgi:hypothetical protein
MHAYETNAQNRDTVYFYMMLVATLLALLLYYPLQLLNVTLPWYIACIGTPTIASFYAILRYFFDNFLWRYKIGQMRLFSAIPDIRGTWKGELHSSYNNTHVEVVLFISQTWTKLSGQLESPTSKSYTTMADLKVDAGENSGLSYEYHNVPKTFSITPEHRGCSQLQLSLDGNTLTGRYYTNSRSKNTGTIILHRITKEILSYQEALKRSPL